MSQRIFDLSLPTELVSLYLLCCGLADIGLSATREALMDRWNGTGAELQAGLASLEAKGIVQKLAGPDEENATWAVNPPADWSIS
jgi:hypothetical protein